jgi:hypothetical protein
MRVPLRTLVLPALAAMALLGGCGGRAELVATDSPQPEAQASATQGAAEAPPGRPLTATQARDAVPPLAVFPAGWRTDTTGGLPSPAEATAEISPARCQVLFDQLHRERQDSGDEMAASAAGKYRSKDGTRFVAVDVRSYETAAAEDLFGKAAQALADCPRFASTGSKPAEFRASPLSFQRLGEENLALRFTGTAAGRPFTLDFVAVRVGRNTITAQEVTFGRSVDPRLLERVATSAVRALPRD